MLENKEEVLMRGKKGCDSPLGQAEIQEQTLNILKAIDQICRSEGLTYWLMYGSLIGAVRHHGFIPWDDDLDIAMPRCDFEKLKEYFVENEKELSPLVFLDYSLKSEGLPFLIARISDTTYRQVGEYGSAVSEMGIFIDIYPLDGMGDSEQEAKRLKRQCEKYVKRYMETYFFKLGMPARDWVRGIKKSAMRVLYGSPKRNLQAVDRLARLHEYETSLYIGNCTWNIGWPEDFYLKEDFEYQKMIDFNGMSVPIPNGYDRVLKKCYGDYMALPPKNERKGHHCYEIYLRRMT